MFRNILASKRRMKSFLLSKIKLLHSPNPKSPSDFSLIPANCLSLYRTIVSWGSVQCMLARLTEWDSAILFFQALSSFSFPITPQALFFWLSFSAGLVFLSLKLVLCIHVYKWKNETCWNCCRNGEVRR
jgi:hypothetical protein